MLLALKEDNTNANWSFVKTSVKQSMKGKVCSNFQMSFFALKSDGHLVNEVLDEIDIFLRTFGQADLWSDVPPGRGI